MNNENIVQKVWNLCNILRGDGISYHEYISELRTCKIITWPFLGSCVNVAAWILNRQSGSVIKISNGP